MFEENFVVSHVFSMRFCVRVCGGGCIGRVDAQTSGSLKSPLEEWFQNFLLIFVIKVMLFYCRVHEGYQPVHPWLDFSTI